jgi:hypothetical protein
MGDKANKMVSKNLNYDFIGDSLMSFLEDADI